MELVITVHSYNLAYTSQAKQVCSGAVDPLRHKC